MYNMDISIGSYKFRIEVIVLIIVVLWILWGHLLFSCSTVGLKEGFDIAKTVTEVVKGKETKKEGFAGGNNIAFTPEYQNYKLNDYSQVDTSKWVQPNLTYSPGQKPDAGVQAIWNRKEQPIPLPEGELDIFATTPFKPECCPSMYTNSTGCACITPKMYDYLTHRGGNNVPYSEY